MNEARNLFDLVPFPEAEPLGSVLPLISPEDELKRIARLQEELNRRKWTADPALWAKERLGDTLWSAQKTIMESVRDHRKTSVKSCHEIGKSYIAAAIAGWWLDIHKPGDAFVLTSAPTAAQVRLILWREIGRMHARGKLRGRTNQTEWMMEVQGKEEQVAIGRKPDEYNPTALQGVHAPFVLVILDEACGIGSGLREAADSLIANDNSKLLEIGNPDDPQTEFKKNCTPGSGYHVISVDAFSSPNFTGEPMPPRVLQQLIGRRYVEEKRKKWATRWAWVDAQGQPSTAEEGVRVVPPAGVSPQDTNPLWQSKVLGEFPERTEDGNLIPLSWILAAQQRTLPPSEPNELGVDVGAGGDSSTIGNRRGPVFRIIHEDRNPDTMATCGNVVRFLEETHAYIAKVDEIGIGRGVVDRGVEQHKPFEGINVGEGARDSEHFVNLRAELYWYLRERFEAGEVDLDPADEDLAGELAELRYKRLSNGKIQIESKDDAKRRGIPSPNRAEAMMLAFGNPAQPGGALKGKATW